MPMLTLIGVLFAANARVGWLLGYHSVSRYVIFWLPSTTSHKREPLLRMRLPSAGWHARRWRISRRIFRRVRRRVRSDAAALRRRPSCPVGDRRIDRRDHRWDFGLRPRRRRAARSTSMIARVWKRSRRSCRHSRNCPCSRASPSRSRGGTDRSSRRSTTANSRSLMPRPGSSARKARVSLRGMICTPGSCRKIVRLTTMSERPSPIVTSSASGCRPLPT